MKKRSELLFSALKGLFIASLLILQTSCGNTISTLALYKDEDEKSTGSRNFDAQQHEEDFPVNSYSKLLDDAEHIYNSNSKDITQQIKYEFLKSYFDNQGWLTYFIVSKYDSHLVNIMYNDDEWNQKKCEILIEETWKKIIQDHHKNTEEQLEELIEILKGACYNSHTSLTEFAHLLGDELKSKKLSKAHLKIVSNLFKSLYDDNKVTLAEMVIVTVNNFCKESTTEIIQNLINQELVSDIAESNSLLSSILRKFKKDLRYYHLACKAVEALGAVSLQEIIQFSHENSQLSSKNKAYIMKRIFDSKNYAEEIADLQGCYILIKTIKDRYFTEENIPQALKMNLESQEQIYRQ